MKEKIQKICSQISDDKITVTEASEELFLLFSDANSSLIEGCRTVVEGYECDSMENMRNRDEVFYKWCKRALEQC